MHPFSPKVNVSIRNFAWEKEAFPEAEDALGERLQPERERGGLRDYHPEPVERVERAVRQRDRGHLLARDPKTELRLSNRAT